MIRKLPPIQKIAPVYAVIVVMIYFPASYHFLWRLPSWLLFSSLDDILSMYSYVLVVNFIESLLFLLFLLGMSVVLPSRWFFENFVSKSVIFTILGLGHLLYLGTLMEIPSPFPWTLVRMTPLILFGIMFSSYFIDQIKIVNKFAMDLSDRMLIFTYISLPVSVLALIVIAVRNLY